MIPLLRRLLGPLLLAAGLAGCHPAPATPEEAANAFFAAIARGDTKAGYDATAFAFQAGQTPESFRANCQALDFIGAAPPVWTESRSEGREATLKGVITNAGHKALDISTRLLREEGAWKIAALHTPEDEPGTGNRFSMVGKGADFRDVFRQPMPAPEQIATLAQETLAGFAAAVNQGSFDSIYRSVSQQWRDGTLPAAGEDKNRIHKAEQGPGLRPDNRLTPGLLQSRFGAFIEKKVDLSRIARTKPVFDEPPRIVSPGYLDLEGHFQDEQYRVNFHFAYVYELPMWRLCGIGMDVLTAR